MSAQGKMRRDSIEQPPFMSDVSIMMLGMTGAGKSASGNTIIGGDRNTFKEDLSPSSVTRICDSEHRRRMTVIDTVGLSDTDVKISDVQSQIAQMLLETNIDVFLLVIKLGETFRSEAVKWIQENFGAKVLKHAIVLFTHGDQLHEPIETYLSKSEILRSVVDQCSGGFHVFNNKDEDPSQVTELLDKINKLKKKNQYMRYTKQDYKETQDELLHRKCVTGEELVVLLLGVMVVLAVMVFSEGAGAAIVSTTVTLTKGQDALIAAAVCAALLVVVAIVFPVYLMKRRSVSKEKDKSN